MRIVTLNPQVTAGSSEKKGCKGGFRADRKALLAKPEPWTELAD